MLQLDEVDPESTVQVYVHFADDERAPRRRDNGFFREFEIQ